MGFHRRVRDDLAVESDTADNPVKGGQEAVVKSPSTTNPATLGGKAYSRNQSQVQSLHGHAGARGGRFHHSEGSWDEVLEAHDTPHPVVA